MLELVNCFQSVYSEETGEMTDGSPLLSPRHLLLAHPSQDPIPRVMSCLVPTATATLPSAGMVMPSMASLQV